MVATQGISGLAPAVYAAKLYTLTDSAENRDTGVSWDGLGHIISYYFTDCACYTYYGNYTYFFGYDVNMAI